MCPELQRVLNLPRCSAHFSLRVDSITIDGATVALVLLRNPNASVRIKYNSSVEVKNIKKIVNPDPANPRIRISLFLPYFSARYPPIIAPGIDPSAVVKTVIDDSNTPPPRNVMT
jgi:hypothetical protein